MELHEKEARSHKVTLLCAAATSAEIDPQDMLGWKLNDEKWKLLAQVAGCNPPHSEESRAMVIVRLLSYERRAAEIANDDPFAGLPRS